jgi:hypothetical protein
MECEKNYLELWDWVGLGFFADFSNVDGGKWEGWGIQNLFTNCRQPWSRLNDDAVENDPVGELKKY